METDPERALVRRLIRLGSSAVSTGLVHGSGGNLSARMPGSDHYQITRSGTWLDSLDEDSFVRLPIGGEIPANARPSSEWKLHDRIYTARPDVNAVVHLHPQYSVLLQALGFDVRFFTLDDALYVKSIGVVPYHPNGSDELADESASAMAEHNCIILANHGCCCVGADVDMAHRRASLMEQAAMNTFNALLLGDRTTAFPEGVELIHA